MNSLLKSSKFMARCSCQHCLLLMSNYFPNDRVSNSSKSTRLILIDYFGIISSMILVSEFGTNCLILINMLLILFLSFLSLELWNKKAERSNSILIVSTLFLSKFEVDC